MISLFTYYTVAAKIIRTIVFLMKDSQNTNLLRFSGYPSGHKKVSDGCDEWSKLYIYFFFSFCSSFEPRESHRTSSTRKRCHIGQAFSTLLTRFERSTCIEISSTRRKRAYRKKITDCSNTFELLAHIYQVN
jgi:hypothetical protein